MTKPKVNHGQIVSQAAHDAQAARPDSGPQGIGPVVSEVAKHQGDGGQTTDFTDGVITVVSADGSTHEFSTFADALATAVDGDTLQVGAGTYAEAIDLHANVNIVGETGAILDGSAIATDAGTQATVELFSGFSGGSITGLDIIAVNGGGAVQSIVGETVDGVTLQQNTFDAGNNTQGSLVYFNPGTVNVVVDANTFTGAKLDTSPMLGTEADNVTISNNTFGDTTGHYWTVEVFPGQDGVTTDVTLVGNTGLDASEITGV